MIKVQAEDLARITKNCMMFVNPKSIYLPGEMLFTLQDNKISGYACDDYFAISDSAPIIGNADTSFVLHLEDVKKLEEFSRKNKKDEIQVTVKENAVYFSANDASEAYEFGEYREDNWYIVEGLIFDPSVTPTSITGFKSNPERYAKLSQLKYDKKAHGIEWRFVETEAGHLLIRFQVGPTLYGVIRPLTEG